MIEMLKNKRGMEMSKKGVLVVVSGPSGVGKGTILKKLIQENDNMRFAISATTRNPREGEQDGINYFFKTEKEFKNMIDNNELIEWVNYCGNFYGKPRKYVEETLKQGYDVIVEVEVEGAQNIKKLYPDSVLIFIMPPSIEELEERLKKRGTETTEVINNRMTRAKQEIAKLNVYDYCVVNDTVDKSVSSLVTIINAMKFKVKK